MRQIIIYNLNTSSRKKNTTCQKAVKNVQFRRENSANIIDKTGVGMYIVTKS